MINTFANLSKSLRRLVYLSSSLWLEACQFEDSKYPKGLQLPVLEIFGFRLAIFKDFSLHLESIFRNYNVPSLWPLKNLPLGLYKERLCQREDSHIPSSWRSPAWLDTLLMITSFCQQYRSNTIAIPWKSKSNSVKWTNNEILPGLKPTISTNLILDLVEFASQMTSVNPRNFEHCSILWRQSSFSWGYSCTMDLEAFSVIFVSIAGP